MGLLRPDGTVVEVNQAALQFRGLTNAEVTGRPFWDTAWWTTAPDPALPVRGPAPARARAPAPRHCEARSAAAIQGRKDRARGLCIATPQAARDGGVKP